MIIANTTIADLRRLEHRRPDLQQSLDQVWLLIAKGEHRHAGDTLWCIAWVIRDHDGDSEVADLAEDLAKRVSDKDEFWSFG